MRVAILSRYNGQVHRGVESWCVNLCHQLEQLGHTCLLIQGGTDVPEGATFRIVSLDSTSHDYSSWIQKGLLSKLVERCYLSKKERDVAQFSFRALPHLLAFCPDIVIPASNFWSVVVAKIVQQFHRGKTRIVVTSQSGWSYLERDDLRLGIDGFVAIQPQIYESAVQFGDDRTLKRLIPNGVDVARFVGGPIAEVPLKRPIAIAVSALDDYKRINLAVRAVAQAGLSLLLLGDGPNAVAINALADALLDSNRFLHLPRVPFAQIPSYYRAADVFTLSSKPGEAFGIVILEAIAAGLPVVVSDDPVRRWIAGNSGWFVDAEDTSNYAQALQSAARTRVVNSVDPYVSRFDWPTVACQFEQLFEQITINDRVSRDKCCK